MDTQLKVTHSCKAVARQLNSEATRRKTSLVRGEQLLKKLVDEVAVQIESQIHWQVFFSPFKVGEYAIDGSGGETVGYQCCVLLIG